MARPKGKRRSKSARPAPRPGGRKRSAKRPTKRSAPARRTKAAAPKRRASAKAESKRASQNLRQASTKTRRGAKKGAAANPAAKSPRLDRARRTLDEVVPTPPSSLNLDRHGSAARTGRAEVAETRQKLAGMSDDIAGGDVDVDVEDAYFTGDEAPGGDNTSPDVDVVDDIGKALGVQYDDAEELKSGDKIGERDKHRWEMDPASSEDYKDRK